MYISVYVCVCVCVCAQHLLMLGGSQALPTHRAADVRALDVEALRWSVLAEDLTRLGVDEVRARPRCTCTRRWRAAAAPCCGSVLWKRALW